MREPKLSITAILDLLVLEAKVADKKFTKACPGMSLQSRAREYGTIKIKSHRQAGHTTAIKSMAGVASLILVGLKRQSVHFKGHMSTCLGIRTNFVRTMTNKVFSRWYPVDYIFVDDASYCRQSDLKKLYDPVFLRNVFGDRFPIIIFMG